MSYDKKQGIFTGVITNTTLVINEEYGVTEVVVMLISGTGFIRGSKSIGTTVSTDMPLAVNVPKTITSEQSKYIDSLIINCAAGSIEVIAR